MNTEILIKFADEETAQRVLNAFCKLYEYPQLVPDLESDDPITPVLSNPETSEEFVARLLANHIIEVVAGAEPQETMESVKSNLKVTVES